VNFPEIATYSASESMIVDNAATGGAGCISASANVNPACIRHLIDGLGSRDEGALLERVSAVRKIFEGIPLTPSIKAAVAAQHGDGEFARLRPPFVLVEAEHQGAIDKAVALAATAGA
jgi:4-hydroxy-tetrahydrodipicolinate synthase